MSDLSDTVDRKFINSINIDDEWEIETDTGWAPVTHIHKTIEYDEWIIQTADDHLICADNHIMFDENMNQKFAKDFIPNESYIMTRTGPQIVKSIIRTERKSNMFDMTVASADHRFYSNNILSHNSTTVTSYIVWKILFQDNQNIGILANKGRLANDLLAKVQLAYENIPMWLQQGVVTWNKGNIELENGSKVLAAATSSSAVRGGSYSMLLLDEFAFVPRNIAENFFASVYPTITSGTTSQIIIVSTPNGMNHYYKMWMDAVEKRSLYKPIEVTWRQIPGRDDAWRDQTIRNTSQEQFDQEFECNFLGSVNTLINPTKIRELAFVATTHDKWGLDFIEAPLPNHTYVMMVDTSHGVGQDYSAFSIIDVTSIPYKLVAKYRNNAISPLMYPEIIYRYGKWYNDAFVLMETNDIGSQVANSLQSDLEYENVLASTAKGRAGQNISSGFSTGSNLGVRMTKQVKRIGCSNIKDLIEDNKLLIQDFDVIEEISTFVQHKESYEAEEGHHDDLMMTLVMFGWLIRQSFFRELTNTDIRAKMASERYSDMMNDLLPAGFIDDGHSPEPENMETYVPGFERTDF